MAQQFPRVYSIAAGQNFLKVLAREVLNGFPLGHTRIPLQNWTILLPTRRAARVFAEVLQKEVGRDALLLPRIRPLGDLDEVQLEEELAAADVPPALPKLAEQLELFRMARQWAHANPTLDFAREISSSPAQLLALAKSLQDFVTTAETQDCDIAAVLKLEDFELAQHREAILGLLELIAKDLPALHQKNSTMGAAARRGAVTRLEAKRISATHRGPIIAAGSTGTIPATRDLLGAISRHPEGAVVLPGLDFVAEDASWNELPAEHAQAAMKHLLFSLGISRKDVKPIGETTARNILVSEMLRPSATAAEWHNKLPKEAHHLKQAMQGLVEIAAPDRHAEATTIAVIMREALEVPQQTVALITPDRDLAARVSNELSRWDISVADSAGARLANKGLGLALDLLLQMVEQDFAAAQVIAFLRHPDVTIGMERHIFEAALQHFEVALLRGQALNGPRYGQAAAALQQQLSDRHHLHPLVKNMSDEAWQQVHDLTQHLDRLAEIFGGGTLAHCIDQLLAALQLACRADIFEERDSEAVLDLLHDLKTEAHRSGAQGLGEAMAIISTSLRSKTRPANPNSHPRLSILGTLEARLLQADVMIMGGLNEGIWPAQPDPGPWINRSMRDKLKLPHPERDIGLAAHDFEQVFCAPKVYLTSAKRIGTAPAQPSRWLLRLDTVRAAAGIARDTEAATRYLKYVAALGAPDDSVTLRAPIARPEPRPPVAARPTSFNATEVEKLIANPYATYAAKVLELEPLPELGAESDARVRGSLFHDAIGQWNKQQTKDEATLLALGEEVFKASGLQEDVLRFWRPHFQQVARFLAEHETEWRKELLTTHAEISGATTFDVKGVQHRLKARADRIDVLVNGDFRIMDYKTSKPPAVAKVESGEKPQLTLEAALLLRGAFAQMTPKAVREALYVNISRSAQEREARDAAKSNIGALAAEHFDRLCGLLAHYLDETLPYYPRLIVEGEREQDFDHLSRYLEWQMADPS